MLHCVHYIQGEKVFYFIKPTRANMRKYEHWVSSSTQSETFFGDMVDDCYKCCIHPGNTLFIPTGVYICACMCCVVWCNVCVCVHVFHWDSHIAEYDYCLTSKWLFSVHIGDQSRITSAFPFFRMDSCSTHSWRLSGVWWQLLAQIQHQPTATVSGHTHICSHDPYDIGYMNWSWGWTLL